jgi:hypothetical protein
LRAVSQAKPLFRHVEEPCPLVYLNRQQLRKAMAINSKSPVSGGC